MPLMNAKPLSCPVSIPGRVGDGSRIDLRVADTRAELACGASEEGDREHVRGCGESDREVAGGLEYGIQPGDTVGEACSFSGSGPPVSIVLPVQLQAALGCDPGKSVDCPQRPGTIGECQHGADLQDDQTLPGEPGFLIDFQAGLLSRSSTLFDKSRHTVPAIRVVVDVSTAPEQRNFATPLQDHSNDGTPRADCWRTRCYFSGGAHADVPSWLYLPG